jgi:hypothetical protein
MTTFAYDLFYPMPNDADRARGRKQPMLDATMGEQPSDRSYGVAYRGEIEAPTAAAALDAIFKRHNVGDNADGDRPNGRTQRSMCVGDVVILNDGSGSDNVWACASMGWDRLYTTTNLYPTITVGA